MNYVHFIYYLFHVAGNTLILEIDIVRDASVVIDDAVTPVKPEPSPTNAFRILYLYIIYFFVFLSYYI